MLNVLLGATILLTGTGVENVEVHNTMVYNNPVQYQNEDKASMLRANEYKLRPAAFNLYLEDEHHEMENTKMEIWIGSNEDMIHFVKELYTKLPYEVTVKSKYFNNKQLRTMFEEAKSYQIPDKLPQMHALASYKVSNSLKSIRIVDNSNKKYSAATIKKAFDAYTSELAVSLKGDSEIDSIENVYDYIYDNFKYNANGMQFMKVGNMANGEMACNGFSYLVDTLMEKMGIQSTIRAGYSHYWNVITTSAGQEITFDVTSDIVLGEYKATFGLSTKDHIMKTTKIGFFSADFLNGKYHEVNAYENTQKLANKK